MKRKGMKISILRKKKKTILSHKKIKGTWVSFIFLANVIFYLETYSDTFHVHFPFYFLESQNNFFFAN